MNFLLKLVTIAERVKASTILGKHIHMTKNILTNFLKHTSILSRNTKTLIG